MTDVHRMATDGFARAADTYVRGRPDFPPAALDWLRGDLAVGPGKTVIDLGAGTGKFTRLLATTGAHVVAIEPVDAMRERLHVGSPEQVIVDRVASVSFIAALENEVRGNVLDEVRRLIARTPSLAGRTEVCVPYLTRAYWCGRPLRAARALPGNPAAP